MFPVQSKGWSQSDNNQESALDYSKHIFCARRSAASTVDPAAGARSVDLQLGNRVCAATDEVNRVLLQFSHLPILIGRIGRDGVLEC